MKLTELKEKLTKQLKNEKIVNEAIKKLKKATLIKNIYDIYFHKDIEDFKDFLIGDYVACYGGNKDYLNGEKLLEDTSYLYIELSNNVIVECKE